MKRKRFWHNIKFKYKLTIVNESTLEEVVGLHVSKLNGLSVLLAVCVVLFVIVALIVSFTPLRNYLPGYMNSEVRKQIVDNALLADSLHRLLDRQNLYIMNIQDIIRARELTREIYVDEKIENYITDIVFATRYPEQYKLDKFKSMISFGASPRASINLALAAKAYAFIKHRGYVIPEDIRAICFDVMRHRIGLSYEAEAENVSSEDILNEILNTVEVP